MHIVHGKNGIVVSQKVCHFICVSELNDAEIATIGNYF